MATAMRIDLMAKKRLLPSLFWIWALALTQQTHQGAAPFCLLPLSLSPFSFFLLSSPADCIWILNHSDVVCVCRPLMRRNEIQHFPYTVELNSHAVVFNGASCASPKLIGGLLRSYNSLSAEYIIHQKRRSTLALRGKFLIWIGAESRRKERKWSPSDGKSPILKILAFFKSRRSLLCTPFKYDALSRSCCCCLGRVLCCAAPFNIAAAAARGREGKSRFWELFIISAPTVLSGDSFIRMLLENDAFRCSRAWEII